MEKKERKISLTTYVLTLIIMALIIIIILMYNNNRDEGKKQDLNISAENVEQTEIAKNNIIENVVEENNNSISFTDEQVKMALSNYLNLLAHAHCDTLLENLDERGELKYQSSKDKILNDGKVITSIKFSDYKNTMLNYITEKEFEKNWTKALSFDQDSNGFLIKGQGGGGLVEYSVNRIEKINDLQYSAKTTATYVDVDDSKENENYKITIQNYKNTCVIDSIAKEEASVDESTKDNNFQKSSEKSSVSYIEIETEDKVAEKKTGSLEYKKKKITDREKIESIMKIIDSATLYNSKSEIPDFGDVPPSATIYLTNGKEYSVIAGDEINDNGEYVNLMCIWYTNDGSDKKTYKVNAKLGEYIEKLFND